jgi:hypothetical protein
MADRLGRSEKTIFGRRLEHSSKSRCRHPTDLATGMIRDVLPEATGRSCCGLDLGAVFCRLLGRRTMRLFIPLIAAIGFATAAHAQQGGPDTVHSLLGRGFAVVGAIPSQIGPGVLLQNKDQLFLCFVSETRGSKSVATQYCKPVE